MELDPVVIRSLVEIFMTVADCVDADSSPGTKLIEHEFIDRVSADYRKEMQRPEMREFYQSLIDAPVTEHKHPPPR